MKKLLLLALALVSLSAIVYAEPTYTGGNGNNGFVIGSKNQMKATALTPTEGQLMVINPTFNQQMVFSAPEAASQSAYMTVSVATMTLVAGATTFPLANGTYTNTITPRNLVIVSTAPATAAVVGSAFVQGVDCMGIARSETISVSTNVATGVWAYSSVTSVTFTITSINNLPVSLQIGSGNAIGVPAMLDSTSEILKVIENKALSTSYTYSTTYNTITFAAAPDGTKNYIVYAMPKMR
ncbi:MAG: hypothetical protein ABSE82_07435 [Nitrososphaerales archaeon]|jgi:hypothetical protein